MKNGTTISLNHWDPTKGSEIHSHESDKFVFHTI